MLSARSSIHSYKQVWKINMILRLSVKNTCLEKELEDSVNQTSDFPFQYVISQ